MRNTIYDKELGIFFYQAQRDNYVVGLAISSDDLHMQAWLKLN